MAENIMMRLKHMACLVLLVCCMVACGQGEQERSEDDTKALEVIDDSIKRVSANTLRQINEGMRFSTDSMTYYEYMARLGKYYYMSTCPDSLALYIDKVMAYAARTPESPRRNSLLAYACNCKAAGYHTFHRNGDEAISLYHKAYDLLMNSDAQWQTPAVCANLADEYVAKNNLPQGAYWYRRALFLVDSLKLPEKENVTLYMGLGRIYLLLRDYDTSLRYYRQTEKQMSEMSVNMQAYFLNNYGNYYYYTRDYKASLVKFLQLKQLLSDKGMTNTAGMNLCKLNLADVYLNLGNVAESEKYLDEVEPYMRDKGDETAIYYCNTIRIGVAVRKGDMARVAEITGNEKPVSGMDFSLRQIRNSYLRKYYEAKGDYQRAYFNLIADNAQNDSLEHNRINMRSSEIMERFAQDTLRLHQRIAMEHTNAEIQKSRSVISAIVSIVVVAILLCVLYVVHIHRKNEKAMANIVQLKLRNVRNRMSPHFIFNVLNTKIASSKGKDAGELMEVARLIRANIDMSCQLEVTLAQELDFVQRYIQLERQMMSEVLMFEMETDSGIDKKSKLVPSMFIQMLVEDALLYSLEGKEGGKTLKVKVKRADDDRIRILVVDNGIGFDATAEPSGELPGLDIVRQTIAVLNEDGKRHIEFSVNNITDLQGRVIGCERELLV